jgi:uncharacterized protein YbaP (TraB family)
LQSFCKTGFPTESDPYMPSIIALRFHECFLLSVFSVVFSLASFGAFASMFRPDVFEISQGSNRVYLIGVTHRGTFPSEFMSRLAAQVFDNADALALESDVSKGFEWAFDEAFRNPSAEDSVVALPEYVRACVEREFIETSTSKEAISKLKSRHISALLLALEAHHAFIPIITTYEGLELAAINQAKARKKAIIELEDPAVALSYYRKLPREQVIEALSRYCRLLSNERSLAAIREANKFELLEMGNGYREEHRSLYEQLQTKLLGQFRYHTKIADARNEKIAENLRQNVLNQYSCSIALVGGLHVTGPDSVQNWLQRFGATIKKLSLRDRHAYCVLGSGTEDAPRFIQPVNRF